MDQLAGIELYPPSVMASGEVVFALTDEKPARRLAVLAPRGSAILARFEGDWGESSKGTALLGPTSAHNAAALRVSLPYLCPHILGLQTTVGMGDRLGLATPGHVRAMRVVGAGIAPIFAQQSIREMARARRTPQQVHDDSTWGIFAEGWRAGVGADADHLKNTEDIDRCLAAGYTFFTIDPGEHVEDAADAQSEAILRAKYTSMPWSELAITPRGLQQTYVGARIDLEDRTLVFEEPALVRAAIKYGRAIAHVVRMYRHLLSVAGPPACAEPSADASRRPRWELEISVDETATPTSHVEHAFIARELSRLGVRWVSLAPRFVGRFEKGADYIPPHGEDLSAFRRDFAGHAAIARACGPYKLSLHSGSDKFSIYEIAVHESRGLVHLKTAGTSYLEALRTVAEADPALFREIYAVARDQYEAARVSYIVSARIELMPPADGIADGDLPQLLDQFDARQVLHVTFGSVLAQPQLASRLMDLLRALPEVYALHLERHFRRHLQPFAVADPRRLDPRPRGSETR